MTPMQIVLAILWLPTGLGGTWLIRNYFWYHWGDNSRKWEWLFTLLGPPMIPVAVLFLSVGGEAYFGGSSWSYALGQRKSKNYWQAVSQ